MSAIPQTTSRPLSESLLQPLREVAWRNWVAVAGRGALQMLAMTLFVWLIAVLLVGFFPKMPLVVRGSLSLLAWGSLLASGLVFLRPALRRRTWSTVARQVEASQADPQELISSAVELSTNVDPRYAGSPELVAHLVQQAEEAARAVCPQAVVSYRGLARWGMIAGPVVLVWLILLPLWPGPMFRGLRHVIAPWRSTIPSSLINLLVKPGDVTIAEGDALTITARLVRGAGNDAVGRPSITLRYPSGQSNSVDMTLNSASAFQLLLEQVTGEVDYRVTAMGESSKWFHVTLQRRPAVAGITVVYTYPSYTRLAPKTEARSDGAIEAVVGTQVKLTARSTTLLNPQSRLLIKADDAGSGEQSLGLALAGGQDYAATFPLDRSGHYRFELIGENGLKSISSETHAIIVRPDQPPTIAITSPAAKLSLPLDDTVPVVFHASDDFGIASVEAIVQLDDQSPDIFKVPLGMREPRDVSGAWRLSIPALLKRHHQTDANRVVYQLRATDTLQPERQRTLTPRQVIEIDHSFKDSLASRKTADAMKSLTEAIQKAIKELGDESVAVDPLVKIKGDRLLSTGEKRTARTAKEALVKTGHALSDVADTNNEGALASLAQAAKAVVTGPIYGAAGDLAGAVLNAGDPVTRAQEFNASADKIVLAKKRLEALLELFKKQGKALELVRTIEDMAKHEEQVAKALEQKLAAKNNDRGREVQAQAELRQRLDEVLAKNQDLNTPQAREAAQRNQQLIQKVEQLEQSHQMLDPLAAKQQVVNGAQAKVNDFAKRQEALNKKVSEFAQKDQLQVKEAGAQLPSPQQLQNIVKGLEDAARAPQANNEQQQAANQIKAAAQQLDNASKENAATAQAQQHDRQDAEQAATIAEQAKELGKEITAARAEDAAKDPNRAREVANQVKQREQQLAQQLEQRSGEMKARDPAQKAEIEAAQKEIADARKAAEQANGDLGKAADADQKLGDAAEKLQSAAAEAEAQAGEERKALNAAGEEARALAQEQKDVADAAAKAAQALAQAKNEQGNDQALQQGEQQAARQADQAANEAGQVQQQDQANSPEMATRAATARTALKEAGTHEQKAAEAAKQKDAAATAHEQQAAEQSLAKAEQSLRGLPDPADALAQGDPAGGDAAGGDPVSGDPVGGDGAGTDPKAADLAAGADPNAAAGDATPTDKGAQAEGSKGDPAASDPSKAAMAKGDSAGDTPAGENKSVSSTEADANSPAANNPAADSGTSGESGKGGSSPPSKSAEGKRATGAAPKPGGLAAMSPKDLTRRVAEEVQAARQAQEEAVNQQRPEAARQAAQALHAAARDLVRSNESAAAQLAQGHAPGSAVQPGDPATGPLASGQPASEQLSPGQGDPGNDSATDPSHATGQQPSANANSRSVDGNGINVAGIGRTDGRPESIRQLGVSASDWAKLPPMTKQDLLNAAQQGGPPEYQEMIRNYFVRIAKLQAEGAGK